MTPKNKVFRTDWRRTMNKKRASMHVFMSCDTCRTTAIIIPLFQVNPLDNMSGKGWPFSFPPRLKSTFLQAAMTMAFLHTFSTPSWKFPVHVRHWFPARGVLNSRQPMCHYV